MSTSELDVLGVPAPIAGTILQRIALVALAAPKRIIAAAAVMMAVCGIFGLPVTKALSTGGFTDPASESVRAADILTHKLNQSYVQLLITVTSASGAHSPAAAQAAADILAVLKSSPDVLGVTSTWTTPPAAAALTSTDGKTGVIVAGLRGSDADYAKTARALVDRFPPEHGGVVVRAGGAFTYADAQKQTEHDLLLMESIAIPVSFVALVWVFGGMLAAALPMTIGIFAILGSLAVLRFSDNLTDVSVFALNLTVAMGLALAVDYSLLIVESLPRRNHRRRNAASGTGAHNDHRGTHCGVLRSDRCAIDERDGPVPELFSAVLCVRGSRGGRPCRRGRDCHCACRHRGAGPAIGRPRCTQADPTSPTPADDPAPRPIQGLFWYRTTHFVMRHAIAVSVTLIAVLMLLGAPFLSVRWGFVDDRVLPATASSRQVGDLLRDEFAVNPMSNVTVVIPTMSAEATRDLGAYAAQLSRVPDVAGGIVAGRNVR